MYIVASYATYIVLSLAVTIWVARTLHKNGLVFLVQAFHGNAELATSINHLLVVGFYLINLGYMSLALRTDTLVDTPRQAIELVSSKIGMILRLSSPALLPFARQAFVELSHHRLALSRMLGLRSEEEMRSYFGDVPVPTCEVEAR